MESVFPFTAEQPHTPSGVAIAELIASVKRVAEAAMQGFDGLETQSVFRTKADETDGRVAGEPGGGDGFSLTSVMPRKATRVAGASLTRDTPAEPPDGGTPAPVVAESVYAGFSEPAVIPARRDLEDGDEDQFAKALSRETVGSTLPERRVTDFLFNPPETGGQTLSLRDVIVYTLKNNPDIGIARWQAEDARHAIRGAQAGLLPSVDLAGSSGVETVFPEGGDFTDPLNRRDASLRVTQRVFDFGKSAQLVKRARALSQSQELVQRDQVEEIVLATVNAYLDLLAVDLLLENSLDNVRAHEEIVKLVEISFRGGNASEAEVKRATTRLDRARTNAIDFENRRENAINNFRRITGLEPGKLAEPRADLSDAYRLTEDQIDVILSDHPALQALVRDANSLRHQLKAVKRANLPEFDVEVSGRFQENVLGNDQWSSEGRAMLRANWNVYDGGRASALSRQLRAREYENEQRIQKLRNALKEDASNIISVLRTSRDKTEIFNEQVHSSERVIELYFKQFEAGRRTLLELLDAQADYALAREESIANRYENLSASFASLRLQNRLTFALADQWDIAVDEAIAEGFQDE